MSKPTKEIIELSRELKGLGYRQEIEMGDWYLYTTKEPFSDGIDECVYLSTYEGILDEEDNENAVFETETIPIPSLDDSFSFLKEHGFIEFNIVDLMGSFSVYSDDNSSVLQGKGKTLHEAALDFMITIMEIEHAKI